MYSAIQIPAPSTIFSSSVRRNSLQSVKAFSITHLTVRRDKTHLSPSSSSHIDKTFRYSIFCEKWILGDRSWGVQQLLSLRLRSKVNLYEYKILVKNILTEVSELQYLEV